MFEQRTAPSTRSAVLTFAELVFVNAARGVRKTHGNAILAVVFAMLQTVSMVAVFYLMFHVMGMRRIAIRGDFLLYLMSGIFMFMTHVKTITAVYGSEGPASPMMQHLPMTTAVSIASAALGTLYVQVLSIVVILAVYDLGWGRVEIYNPAGAMGMLLLAWFSGIAIGMVFLAMKPWMPGFTTVAQSVFTRANMIASGKMFVANTLPGYMLVMFSWNPLFHVIDQTRGFTFINYNPHYTSIAYPFYVSLGLLMIGLMGEFYTRRHASASWGARR